MAFFKCKMCGGDLIVNDQEKVAECEFCGTRQTLPAVKDENLRGLFNRANVLRMKSEFDRAEEIYEKILQMDDTEAEAHWGIILCKYGVEYVEDPKTFRRIPTCHRTSYDAITADEDYKAAIQYADMMQRSIYESEAKAIDEIQKGILKISENEAAYDVFICYKETDANGSRTVDSSIGNDIYYQLTEEGFKVFYAAITLEDKLGTEYEPYIFAALNSAKVMLVIGTKPEFFNAVWVKNEWSRYLKLMKSDRSRLLIPCYRDMDAYELPEEFSHLQAQNMAKIGFINDIIRGIKKVLKKEESSKIAEGVSINTQILTAEPLLKRAYMSLEDGEWEKADNFCEQVLNINPENAMAYVGKVMVVLHVHQKEELGKQAEPFENNGDYKKALRFADESLKNELQRYNDSIKYRNKDAIYINAVEQMSSAKTEEAYADVIKEFQTIIDHKDAKDLIEKCKELCRQVHADNQIMNAKQLLDHAFTVSEISHVIDELGEEKDIPEIKELIFNAQTEYKGRIPIAVELWEEYTSIKGTLSEYDSKISSMNAICKSSQKKMDNLKERIAALSQLKREIRALEQNLQSCNEEISNLLSQLDKEKGELGRLGLFAVGAKKEANVRINSLQARIDHKKSDLSGMQQRYNSIQKDISNAESEEAMEQNILSLERTIRLNTQEKTDIRNKIKEITQQTNEIGNKVITPKYLGILLETSDAGLFVSIMSDPCVAAAVKQDSKMLQIAQSNINYNTLPAELASQYKSKKKSGLDVETIYFQACQAMDNPASDADILWAEEQFAIIEEYKDSATRLTECNRKIAGG